MLKWVFILCLAIIFPDRIFPQNAPVSIAGSRSTYGNETTISIRAVNFINIASCNLELHYDPLVASCKAVTTGSLLGGNINTNLSFQGRILIGWYAYPGVTLEDSTVIFNIEFEKADNGTTIITWFDDGYSCIYYNANAIPLNDLPNQEYYQGGSLSFISAIAPVTTLIPASGCPGDSVWIPVLVDGFRNIGEVRLVLNYDPSFLIFNSFTGSAFPELNINQDDPGRIIIQGTSDDDGGVSLADNTTLVTLNFIMGEEDSAISFEPSDSSCNFKGPSPEFVLLDDEPFTHHYSGCLLTPTPLPGSAGEIAGPQNGYVCRGEKDVILSVDSIPGATVYEWDLPQGIFPSDEARTRSIHVSVGSEFRNGYVKVKGVNSCGAGIESPELLLTDTISMGIIGNDQVARNNDIRIDYYHRTSPGEIEVCCYLPEEGILFSEVYTLLGKKVRDQIIRSAGRGSNVLRFSFPDPEGSILILRLRLSTDHRIFTLTEKMVN